MAVRNERDYLSFEQLSGDDWARRVKLYSGGLVADIAFDAIAAAYPSSVSEQYTFYSGGLSGTVQAVVTVTYTDSTKENISSVVRV